METFHKIILVYHPRFARPTLVNRIIFQNIVERKKKEKTRREASLINEQATGDEGRSIRRSSPATYTYIRSSLTLNPLYLEYILSYVLSKTVAL